MIAQANSLHIPLPDKCIHTVITSPPYWNLRDYGVEPTVWPDGWEGCLGLEPNPSLYIRHIVIIFQEVWRVLRNDGTAWLNLGDVFAANRSYQVPDNKWKNVGNSRGMDVPAGLKPKDLIGIPWAVALALRNMGWYLRRDIIWHKSNSMPENVTDRPASAHEYVFLLSKSPRYYFDMEAIKEPAVTGKWPGVGPSHAQVRQRGEGYDDMVVHSVRNKRSVWTLPTIPYKGAHFATFPINLITPMILSGTSKEGCCATCGAPLERIVENVVELEGGRKVVGIGPKTVRGGDKKTTLHHCHYIETVGWKPTCECYSGEAAPCRVLDPFCGSGTVGAACKQLGREFIGLDLSFTYLQELALARAEGKTSGKLLEELPLFGGNL